MIQHHWSYSEFEHVSHRMLQSRRSLVQSLQQCHQAQVCFKGHCGMLQSHLSRTDLPHHKWRVPFRFLCGDRNPHPVTLGYSSSVRYRYIGLQTAQATNALSHLWRRCERFRNHHALLHRQHTVVSRNFCPSQKEQQDFWIWRSAWMLSMQCNTGTSLFWMRHCR